MTADRNKEIARRFGHDIADNHNPAAVDELLDADYVGYFTGAPGPLDRAGMMQFVGVFHAAFPGVTHTFEELVAEGETVVARLTVRGTHQHEFMGLPPTGRTFEIASINVFHLRDGKIVEQHAVFDSMAMMQQLGAIPAPGATPA